MCDAFLARFEDCDAYCEMASAILASIKGNSDLQDFEESLDKKIALKSSTRKVF